MVIVCESCEKPIMGDVVPYEDANICQGCHNSLKVNDNLAGGGGFDEGKNDENN